MRITEIVLASVGLTALAGCSGDNLFRNSDITLVDRPAGFEAVRFEFEPDDGDPVDLIAEGARFQLTLDPEDRTFESDFLHQDIDVRVEGTFDLDDGAIIFSDDPFTEDDSIIERRFDFEDAGDVIFLGDPSTVWDVDNDGVEEVVSLEIRMERDD